MPVLEVVVGVSRGLTGGIGGVRKNWGLHIKMKMVYSKVLLKTQNGLLQKVEHELSSTGPKLVPFLATILLGVHLTEGQPNPKADQMSR